MARIVSQHDIADLTGPLRHAAYNAMDTLVTREVWDALMPKLDAATRGTYLFEMAQQAPAMAMMLRGVRVDRRRRDEGIKELRARYEAQEDRVNELVGPWWTKTEKETGSCPTPKRKDGKHSWPRSTGGPPPTPRSLELHCAACGQPRMKRARFNAKSSQATKWLLYTAMGLEKKRNKKGDVTADKEALLRLSLQYPQHSELLLGVRDAKATWKLASILSTNLSPDGRMRSGFNVGATETGRWSSSHSPEGDRIGMNLQNVPGQLRDMFVADPGRVLFYADLEQAESRIVAYISGDEAYIAAHHSGDVHTFVTRKVWAKPPVGEWTWELERDRKLAEQPDPMAPGKTLRDSGKGNAHGSNYRLTPYGLARAAKITVKAAEAFQRGYFGEFTAIRPWQDWCEARVRRGETISNPLGRRRAFYGRPWDAHTHRQAIAHGPQSCCVDILDLGMLGVYRELDPHALWLLAQVHDAILGELPLDPNLDTTLTRVEELMTLEVAVTDIYGVTRPMVIPVDVQVGFNWRKAGPENPNGMRKWKPGVGIEYVAG